MQVIFAAVFLFSMAVCVRSECCGRSAMYWAADSCWPYDQHYYMTQAEGDVISSSMLPTRCIAKVCGDGKKHEGLYCGKGKCNIFGCDCDGGCIQGSAEENFRKATGISDASAGFSFTDPTTWHGQ